jgi:hypothetical protein
MLRAELAAAEGSDTRIEYFSKQQSRPLVVVDDRPEGVERRGRAPSCLTAGEARIEISAQRRVHAGFAEILLPSAFAPRQMSSANRTRLSGTAITDVGHCMPLVFMARSDKHVNDGEVMQPRAGLLSCTRC